MDDVTWRGLDVFGELMGPDAKAKMAEGLGAEGFGSALSKLACDYAFASVWGRDGLERTKRSCVILGVLIAQRQHAELKNHVRIALNNGLTPREIEEVLIQTVPYVGFPAVASAVGPIIEVMRERGVDTTSQSPNERGML